MALVATEGLPEHAGTILTLTIGSTIVFELIGPVATVWAVRRVAAAEEAEIAARGGGASGVSDR